MPEEDKLSQQKKGFELTEAAQFDLESIWEYVAEYNEQAATKLIKELFEKFQLLATQRKLGKRRDEILLNLRSFPLKNYIIFYNEIEGQRIEIYRILHASRDIEGLFEELFESLEE